MTGHEDPFAGLPDRPPDGERSDVTVETLGLLCPLPLVKTARALIGQPAGLTVEVLADDPGALTDFPVWCAERGHDYRGAWRDGPVLHVLIRKGNPAPRE